MKNQSNTTHTAGSHYPKVMRASEIVSAFENTEEFKSFFQQYHLHVPFLVFSLWLICSLREKHFSKLGEVLLNYGKA